jgi:hypothetical protein
MGRRYMPLFSEPFGRIVINLANIYNTCLGVIISVI